MNKDFDELGGRDPHVVLGVGTGASRDQITRAFRRSAAQGAHPDLGGDNRTFRQLACARDVLLDPHRLAAYETARRVHFQGRRTAEARPSAGPRHSPGPATHHARPAASPGNHAHASGSTATRYATTVPARRPSINIWAVLTVMLLVAGPLVWPLIPITGLLALRRLARAGRREHAPA